ncbi:MAG: uncharacterized protein QG622_2411 [Actinomycetota bacterium]|nr:uncharacterized protein [Actinomycetota bacterium]
MPFRRRGRPIVRGDLVNAVVRDDTVSPAVEPPALPALVVGRVTHVRHTPVRHAFTYRHYQWLVDLDHLPALPGPLRMLARFDPRDHLDGGRDGGGLRGDLTRFLAGQGITLDAGDRVIMMAHARIFGHTFDPLTVFWCLTSAGAVRAVVFEVHNTYGGRHAYLVDLDEHGAGTVDKRFYVSPFNDVSGSYAVRLRLRPDVVAATVVLERDGRRVLTAAVTGTPKPATTATALATIARHLPMTHRVSVLIRLHGIWLWLRRLPVVPRAPRPETSRTKAPRSKEDVR